MAGEAAPHEVSVLGFPAAERQPVGFWRSFTVAGTVGDGLVQLDWTGDVGTLPGHSGGPVVNADVDSGVDGGLGALVGILVQGGRPAGLIASFRCGCLTRIGGRYVIRG